MYNGRDFTCDHIAAAETTIKQLQYNQLDWARTSTERTAALSDARTRSVLRVAARFNFIAEDLHVLLSAMLKEWSVAREQDGTLFTHMYRSVSDLLNGTGDGEASRYQNAVSTLEYIWPDVVADTDEWARRICGPTTDGT